MAIATRKPALFDEEGLKYLCSDSPAARQLVAEGLKVFCSIPLLSNDRALGALNVGPCRDEAFSAAALQEMDGQLDARQREAIEAALRASRGRVSGASGAALLLSLPHSTLEFRIKKLGIDKFQFRRKELV